MTWLFVLQAYDRDSYGHYFHSVHPDLDAALAVVGEDHRYFADGWLVSAVQPGGRPYHFSLGWERGDDTVFVTDPRNPYVGRRTMGEARELLADYLGSTLNRQGNSQ